MPPLIVAAAAALASAAVGAGVTAALGGAAATIMIAGFSVSAAAVGAFAGAVAGALVAYAGNALLASTARKPSVASTAADARQMIRSSVEPRRVVYGRARVSGPIIYAASTGPFRQNLTLVIPVAGHVTGGYDGIWLNDQYIAREQIVGNLVVEGPFANNVVVAYYDGRQTEADVLLQTVSPDGWGANDKLLGVSYFVLSFSYDENMFRNGVPNFSALVIGKNDIFDPRYGTRIHSENWALVILDYLRSPFGLNCAEDEIDIDSFMAAANISDEAVPISEDGTQVQPRYNLNGTFQLDRAPIEVVEEMVAAGGGKLVYVQGKYRLFAGAYVPPSVLIRASDLAGPIELSVTQPRRERFNVVKGTYIEPSRSWQAAEFPPVTDQAAIAEDGEQIPRDLDLPWIKNVTAAQRVALQLLKRHRASNVVRVPLRYASFAITVGDTVALDLPDFGFVAKPFGVIAWTFDPGSGIITVTLQEEQPAAYAFTTSEAKALPVFPNTTLVSPFSLPAPSGLAVTEALYATRDGAGVRNKAVLTWSPVPNPFVTAYDVQFRVSGIDAPWQNAGAFPGSATTAEVLDLATGSKDFRVRARTTLGSGAWAQVSATIGLLASAPPADVADLAIQVTGGMAWARWTRHPDLDVRSGGRIEFRHHPESTGVWANATSIGEAVPGDANFTALPLRTGTYFAKAVDAGGRRSVNAASFYILSDGQFAYTNVAARTYDPGFAGTNVNTTVIANTLRLESGGDFDLIASVDAVANLDALGGVVSAGTTTLTSQVNLGSAQHVRVTPLIRALVINTFDQIDSRAGAIDSWADFDGFGSGGEADAWFEMRSTQTDPAGTPTYTPWARIDGTEVRAWGMQFRLQLRSFDPAFNVHIEQARISVDQVV